LEAHEDAAGPGDVADRDASSFAAGKDQIGLLRLDPAVGVSEAPRPTSLLASRRADGEATLDREVLVALADRRRSFVTRHWHRSTLAWTADNAPEFPHARELDARRAPRLAPALLRNAQAISSAACEDCAMRRRLPWILALPLALAGSRVAHLVGRALLAGSIEGREAAEHYGRAATAHSGVVSLDLAAAIAPLAAIALIVLIARWWTRSQGKPWGGAGPIWFLILPVLAYLAREFLERLTSGGSEALSLHAAREPGLLLALVLQVPFGALAYVIARLLLATARAIVAKVRKLAPETRPRQQTDVTPSARIAPTRWSCLVGAHGLRGPPVLFPA
jgi:hypothetical protein